MKHIFNILLILLVLTGLDKAQAQNGDLLLESDAVTVNGGENALTSTFQISGTSFVWSQYVNGNEKTTGFAIVSSTQDWDPNTSQGLNVYDIEKDGVTCRFTLSGNESGIKGTFQSDTSNPDGIHYIFTIHSITQL